MHSERLTTSELEEMIYYASAYTGLPAAATARQVAKAIVDRTG